VRDPDDCAKKSGLYPPLGLAQIAAVCRKNGHEIKIVDADALGLSVKQVKEEAAKFSPQILCVSLWTSTFENELEGARILKEEFGNIVLIVGGPHMDLYAHETMERFRFIDYGVIGEGEETIEELLSALDGRRPVEQVNGLVFLKDGRITMTGHRGLISSLDDIPFLFLTGCRLRSTAPTWLPG